MGPDKWRREFEIKMSNIENHSTLKHKSPTRETINTILELTFLMWSVWQGDFPASNGLLGDPYDAVFILDQLVLRQEMWCAIDFCTRHTSNAHERDESEETIGNDSNEQVTHVGLCLMAIFSFQPALWGGSANAAAVSLSTEDLNLFKCTALL